MSWRINLRSSLTNNMRFFKNNNTNITIFFAASFLAGWNFPKLIDAEHTVNNEYDKDHSKSPCPSYGCPMLPRDMFFDEEAQNALKAIRTLYGKNDIHDASRGDGKDRSSSPPSVEEALQILESSGGNDQVTLTLTGYKGGKLEDQINQDRAFVISPFIFPTASTDGNKPKRLLGVFDGHAKLGEFVSEYTVSQLPKLLSSKLEKIFSQTNDESEEISTQQKESIKTALVETFIEIDKTAPAEVSGGCTATVVLQIGRYIYIANAGDSRSFIATHNKKTDHVDVVYITREDKPHLPDERARVEKMGGSVYIPPNGATSRVLYIDHKTGTTNGLAMSRSIGDWNAGKLGVIPDPTVDIVDLLDLYKSDSHQIDGNIEVFAVSATDGLLDYVEVEDIAKTIANSLYTVDAPHPLSACETLITKAATGWWKAKNGRYRDDIAIAVSKINLDF